MKISVTLNRLLNTAVVHTIYLSKVIVERYNVLLRSNTETLTISESLQVNIQNYAEDYFTEDYAGTNYDI